MYDKAVSVDIYILTSYSKLLYCACTGVEQLKANLKRKRKLPTSRPGKAGCTFFSALATKNVHTVSATKIGFWSTDVLLEEEDKEGR